MTSGSSFARTCEARRCGRYLRRHLVLGLLAGAWMERMPPRRVVIAASVAVSPALFASPLRRMREFDDNSHGSFA